MTDTSEMDALYSETEGGEDTSDKSENADKGDKADKEDMAVTAVVPIKVLQSGPDMEIKDGDEIVVQVVKVFGDEAEIRYGPKKEKESEHNMASDDDAEIESLSKEGAY